MIGISVIKILLEISTFSKFFECFNSSGTGSKAILLQMAKSCLWHVFRVQYFNKLFHWMIQVWSENLIFFIFQKSNTALIQASMTYCANVIGALFYLLMGIFNLITTFFIFLTFLILDFWIWISFMKFGIFLVPLFISFFNLRIWWVFHFLIIFFNFTNF